MIEINAFNQRMIQIRSSGTFTYHYLLFLSLSRSSVWISSCHNLSFALKATFFFLWQFQECHDNNPIQLHYSLYVWINTLRMVFLFLCMCVWRKSDATWGNNFRQRDRIDGFYGEHISLTWEWGSIRKWEDVKISCQKKMNDGDYFRTMNDDDRDSI